MCYNAGKTVFTYACPKQYHQNYNNLFAFKYLGAFITENGDCSKEIQARLGAARGAVRSLDSLWKDRSLHVKVKLECGPMPNLMVALPNTGGALCSTPQSLADAHY